MAPLLTPADFRPESTAEPCRQLALALAQADDADLTASIARMTRRVDDLANDQFEQIAADTMELDVWVCSSSVPLTKRTTSIASVNTRDYAGNLTLQASSSVYRLNSSLSSGGDRAVGDFDSLEILGLGLGIAGVTGSQYEWPYGPQTVQVIGATGWTVPHPDALRAVALLVWNHFTTLNADLRRAKSASAGDTSIVFVPDGRNPYNDKVASSGLPEVDEIVAELYRDNFAGLA
jgi:hypothetical protein